MINLTKLEEPDVLRLNGEGWLQVLEDKIAAGEKPTESEKGRYRHVEIKERLKEETHGKCAYCESHLLHITYGDVEHITPKSPHLHETFRWENLTLACDVCNTNKGTVAGIFDPYINEPAEAFSFLGPMIVPRAGNHAAVLTEKQLKLNRGALVERRLDKLRVISDQLLVLANAPTEELRAVIRQDLEENETGADKEYSAFVRSFLDVMLI
ncbi:HNH endonuclease [Agrobacterium tumefaciens]|uniref:HNH endonuclease n=1 Tax=Agrobacterium tumefaciens TaxID=358 RepID=UPI003BA23364